MKKPVNFSHSLFPGNQAAKENKAVFYRKLYYRERGIKVGRRGSVAILSKRLTRLSTKQHREVCSTVLIADFYLFVV